MNVPGVCVQDSCMCCRIRSTRTIWFRRSFCSRLWIPLPRSVTSPSWRPSSTSPARRLGWPFAAKHGILLFTHPTTMRWCIVCTVLKFVMRNFMEIFISCATISGQLLVWRGGHFGHHFSVLSFVQSHVAGQAGTMDVVWWCWNVDSHRLLFVLKVFVRKFRQELREQRIHAG